MRSVGSGILGFSLLLAPGCFDYSPRTAHSVGAGGMVLEAKRIRIGLSVGFDQQAKVAIDVLEASPERRLRWVTLVPAADPPCAGPTTELRYEITGSGGNSFANVLRPGAQLVVTIPSREWNRVDEVPARLDLRLESAEGDLGCVSVPLFSRDPDEQWELDQRWAFFARTHYERLTTPLDGLDYRAEGSIGVGRWFGGLMVGTTIGFHLAQCPGDTCPLAPVGDIRQEKFTEQSIAGPFFGLEVNSWPLQAGMLTAGAGVRYWAREAMLPALTGHRAIWLHGPELVPHVGISDLKWLAPGVPGGPRLSAFDLEFPVGLAFSGQGKGCMTYGVGLNVQVVPFW